MVARIIEVGMAFILLFGMVFFLQASGVAKAPLYKEGLALNEQLAKYALLALENFNSTGDGFRDKSIMDLIALSYLTRREDFLVQAEEDINYYLPRVIDAEWHVYTKDGELDIKSENYDSTKMRGSAKTEVLSFTELIVVVGF